MRVKVVEDKSTGDFRQCRRMLCGMGINEPDPFPGYGGFIGWETPCTLKSGEQLVSFNAGYWHASLPTPVDCPEEMRTSWARGGCPVDIDAPRGGRAMLIRSGDDGLTWSKPETIIDTERDDRHPALCELDDGTILCLLFGIDGWYGCDAPPPGKGKNSITGVIRSFDGGKTFEQKLNSFPSPFKYYERMCAGFVKASDGSVLAPTYGKDSLKGPDRGAVYRSTDGGAAWKLLAVFDTDSSEAGFDEPAVAEVAPGKLVAIARTEGDICFSEDMGKTWTAPATFGMRMWAPKLLTLRDGTLLCLYGYHRVMPKGKPFAWDRVSGAWNFINAIWSLDGGKTWIAPASDHGFTVDDSVYLYAGGVEMDDGSVWCVYYDKGKDQTRTGTWSIRFRINENKDGLDILPVPGAGLGGEAWGGGHVRETLDADAM